MNTNTNSNTNKLQGLIKYLDFIYGEDYAAFGEDIRKLAFDYARVNLQLVSQSRHNSILISDDTMNYLYILEEVAKAFDPE